MNILSHEELVSEGLVKLVVPKADLYRRPDGSIEPAWMPVFYNPRAIVSRDLTTLLLRTALSKTDFYFVDLLSGTGVRGLRIAAEVGGSGIVNDVDPRAYYYITRNIVLNNLEGRLEAFNNEANVLLNALVFTGIYVDYIDVDPYGSPVPFLDSVFKPIGREAYIGITATDVASLACTYPQKTLSRYWDRCIKVDFEKEYAARLLIANVVMRAAALEIDLRPLLTSTHGYFIRVFFKARRGASKAHKVINECIGYIWYCKNTLERGFVKKLEDVHEVSCADGSKPIILGKTWICEIGSEDFVLRMLNEARKMPWLRDETLDLLRSVSDEIALNTPYIRLDRLCSVLGVNMPSIKTLIEELRAKGISCSRTHMDPRGIRVVSDHRTLIDTILSLTLAGKQGIRH